MIGGLVATWNDTPSSSYPELIVTRVRRGGYGAVRNVTVNVPGREGAWMFAESRGLRNISADCILASNAITGRRADVTEIADWLDVVNRAKLVFSDQPDRYWMAAISSDIDPDEWKRLSKFRIDWEAEPYAYALSTSSICATATGGVYSSSPTIDDGIIAYPEVVITALNGSGASAIAEFTLTVNGDSLTVDQDFAANVPINVSSISQTVTQNASIDTNLTGAFDTGQLVMAGASGDFGVLIPGVNSIGLTWSGSATSVRMCINWRRRYR